MQCPECQWRVPLAPSWVIGRGTRTVAKLVPDPIAKRFDFTIESDVPTSDLEEAAERGTAKDSEVVCPNPNCGGRTPMKAIRGDGRGTFGESRSLLRGWEKSDIVPRHPRGSRIMWSSA